MAAFRSIQRQLQGVVQITKPQFVACSRKTWKPHVASTRSSSTLDKYEYEIKSPKYHNLDNVIPEKVILTRTEALKYYKEMQQIRRMEAEASKLYKEQIIRGFCHLYTGQEACCIGMNDALEKEDSVITAYRAHGWTFVKGRTMKEVLSELTGRKTGCTQGKGGSMHMYGHEFYGGNGIVGAQSTIHSHPDYAKKWKGAIEEAYAPARNRSSTT